MQWSIDPFEDCYNSILKHGVAEATLIEAIREDLRSLLVHPGRCDKSKSQLINENELVTFSNGDQYKLNREFVDAAGVLAAELNLDELATAELLWNANKLSFDNGTSFIDSGRYAYFTRAQYILNIAGYLVLQNQLDSVVEDYDKFFSTILLSYKTVYAHVARLNDQIDKQKVTGDINSLPFTSAVAYLRSNLFKFHETLAEIQYGLVSRYFSHYNTPQYFTRAVEHIAQNLADEDVLVLHCLPTLFWYVSHLDDMTQVEELHKTITQKLSTDYLKLSSADEIHIANSALKGFEVLIYMFFFIYFITWCKLDDSRIRKFDFKDDCLKYIEMVISYGAAEKFLCCTADSADRKTTELIDMRNLYDFRSLLQKVFPTFTSVKFSYPNQDLQGLVSGSPEMANVKLLLVKFTVSEQFSETLLAPYYHEFFREFVNNAAIVMTLLRDNEEDFLLSSLNKQLVDEPGTKPSSDFAGIDVDEIAEVADLERLYLAFSYTYINRPELCAMLWVDEELSPDIIGFINWGLSYNTSPLIAATFCLLLGSITYAGPSSAMKVWDLLVSNNNASLKKNDYLKISVDSIVDSLEYYTSALFDNFDQDMNALIKQHQKRQDFMFSANYPAEESESVTIELAEDSVVYISGFVQLLSLIVRNISAANISMEDTRTLKSTIFARFLPIITDFLRFDNTVMGAKYTGDSRPFSGTISVNTDTRVVLINLMLSFLQQFVHENDDLTLRYQVWTVVDRWMCHAIVEKEPPANDFLGTPAKNRVRLVTIEEGLLINLTHVSQVSNFVDLMVLLLAPLHDSHRAFSTYKLLYPPDLGAGYRPLDRIGVWPYMAYLLTEVFGKSVQLEESYKTPLQMRMLTLMERALGEIDWHFLAVEAPKLVQRYDIGSVFDTSYAPLDFPLFVRLHHALAVLHFMYDERVSATLFSIVDLGIEATNASASTRRLVELCLRLLEQTLLLQEYFVGLALPVLKDNSKPQPSSKTSMSLVTVPSTAYERIALPQGLGNGVVDFSQVFLFHLHLVATLALYAGSDTNLIARPSLAILSQLASSPHFNGRSGADRPTENNRLLTVFESVDESVRIQYGFIQQLLRDPVSADVLELQLDMLRFLSANLHPQKVALSHFLLGYKYQGGALRLAHTEKNTLLKTLLVLVESHFASMAELDYQNGNRHVVDVGSTTVVALIMEILAQLCRHAHTSATTLSFIRSRVSGDLFGTSLSAQPVVDGRTIWTDCAFDGELHQRLQNRFIQSPLALGSLFAFIQQRNLVLQLLALNMVDFSSGSKSAQYKQVLLTGQNTLNGAPKLLSFLDVLNFEFSGFGDLKVEGYAQKYHLQELVLLMNRPKKGLGQPVDFSVIEKTFMLLCRGKADGVLGDVAKDSLAQQTISDGNYLADYLTKVVLSSELESLQVTCVHSWCQLVQAMMMDDSMDTAEKTNLVMEVYQVVLPKINDLYDTRMRLCEELISLCVPLFDVFDGHSKRILKLVPLLLTCINGISSSTLSPELRSDLYVLASKYLRQILPDAGLTTDAKNLVRATATRLLSTVCNDATSAEGAPRITSLLFLEAVLNLASHCEDDFAMSTLTKSNALVLLVHSLKRSDEVIAEFLSAKPAQNMGPHSLVYELIAFKTMLYVFLRIAQTRKGASQLVQNDIFTIFKLLRFIAIDPDLGMDLRLSSPNDTKFVVNFSLDHSLATGTDSSDGISYFEFLVPAFQVICAILVAMGPSYKPTMIQAKELMRHFRVLIVGVLKRDVLVGEKKSEYSSGLQQMVELFTLLDTLVMKEDE